MRPIEHQTKIREGGTKDDDLRILKALFEGVSTQFWLRTIEMTVEISRASFVTPPQIFVWEG